MLILDYPGPQGSPRQYGVRQALGRGLPANRQSSPKSLSGLVDVQRAAVYCNWPLCPTVTDEVDHLIVLYGGTLVE